MRDLKNGLGTHKRSDTGTNGERTGTNGTALSVAAVFRFAYLRNPLMCTKNALHLPHVVLDRAALIGGRPPELRRHRRGNSLGGGGGVIARLERDVCSANEQIAQRLRHLIRHRIAKLAHRVRQIGGDERAAVSVTSNRVPDIVPPRAMRDR